MKTKMIILLIVTLSFILFSMQLCSLVLGNKPVVTITSPEINQQITTTKIIVEGTIRDQDGDQSKVEVWIEDKNIKATDFTVDTGIFNVELDLSNLNAGTYNIMVQGYDKNNNVSEIIYVSINYDINQTSSGTIKWNKITALGARNWRTISTSSDGKHIAAAYNGGYIHISNDYGNSWSEQTYPGEKYWSCVDISDNGQIIMAIEYGNIWVSNDSGQSWDIKYNSASSFYSLSTSSSGQYSAVGTSNSKILFSNDYGNSWVELNNSPTKTWYDISISANGSIIVGCTFDDYIYKSIDYGNTWTALTSADDREWLSISISSDGSKIAAGTNGGYIYTSNDSGNTWNEQIKAGNNYWSKIDISDDGLIIVAVSNNCIKTTIDSGANWYNNTTDEITGASSISMNSTGTKIYICIWGGYIWSGTFE